MAFATDRDLLALEPQVFRDVSWNGQERAGGSDAQISGVTLSSASSDFAAAGIDAGQVAVVAGVALEILARGSATELTVSLIRDALAGPALAPKIGAGAKPFTIHTFLPQVRIIHAQTMRALGLEAGDEAMVLNPDGLTLVEALGALHCVYSGAAALTCYSGVIALRAEMYRERAAIERSRVVAEIDTDGDGVADVVRRMNMVQPVRA